MRISVIINSMDAGGAERAASRIVNYWAIEGNDVYLLLFGDKKDSFYELNKSVKIRALNIANTSPGIFGGFKRNIKRITTIRSELRQIAPDVVVSFMNTSNVLSSLSSYGLDMRCILSEQTYPKMHNVGLGWNVMRLITYPMSDQVVCVSRSTLDCFPYFIRTKSRVIPNPVVPKREEIGEIPGQEEREKVICAMGRLSKTKGFDMLLRSFSRIADACPEWTLEIWGEGEERQTLEALRDQLGLGGRVLLPGLTERPFEQMKRASFFVLSSRYEGFGNVLVEALSCKLPVLSFDCPSGPREIIRPGVDGELVPTGDVGAMARSMHRLIENPDRRARYAERADEVRERFGLDVVMSMWDDLIQDVI